ncbi:hypothetical protein NL676_004895 [Syzygium grande]|nr:hypothetical protein NL676_004895 [Syzygium grande]
MLFERLPLFCISADIRLLLLLNSKTTPRNHTTPTGTGIASARAVDQIDTAPNSPTGDADSSNDPAGTTPGLADQIGPRQNWPLPPAHPRSASADPDPTQRAPGNNPNRRKSS